MSLFALNLHYLSSESALGLAPDEAHYWLWSRDLDWSYYSKGPLVAWLIRLSCEVWGETAFAVRFPAAMSGLLTCWAMLLLYRRLLPERWAITGLLILLTIPACTACSILMTIDAPFLCCWAWASVAMVHLQRQNRVGLWIAAGLLTALGLLAKYTMVLFPLSVILYMLLHQRFAFRQAGLWIYLLISSLGGLPILIWNANNDWIGLNHLLSLAKLNSDSSGPGELFGPVRFVAGQFVFLQGVGFGFWIAAMLRFRPWRVHSPVPSATLYWYLSAPAFLVFAVASCKGTGPLNWAAPAYVTGLPLALLFARRMLENQPLPRWWIFLTVVCLLSGLLLSFAARYPRVVRPLLSSLASPPSFHNPTPLRSWDPTCRLSGWQTLAQKVDSIRVSHNNQTGEDLLIAAMTWTVPGELAFYCSGQPIVYSFGLRTGDRHSQFDIWRPNPIADAQVFRGRSFVYVGELNTDLLQAFDRVGPPVEVLASDGGIPVASWKVYVLEGFRGFPAAQPNSTPKRY